MRSASGSAGARIRVARRHRGGGAGGAEGGAAAGGTPQSWSRAQPSGRWLFASFPKVAPDKSIYLGQIVSEKLPLELPWTKPAV